VPDLILVDGGRGQLNAARKVLANLGLRALSVISLAKKEETLYTSSQKKGLMLERTSPTLRLFQRIRDEAHRFAVTFHRLRRAKKSFESPLDDIPGIGPKRKTALLAKYKSLEAIRKANQEELAQMIGPKAAKELKVRLKS
jgi:excinuclease ABC subunit C